MLENSKGTMENPENHKDYTHFYFCILEKNTLILQFHLKIM